MITGTENKCCLPTTLYDFKRKPIFIWPQGFYRSLTIDLVITGNVREYGSMFRVCAEKNQVINKKINEKRP